jgi:hypothetical protein
LPQQEKRMWLLPSMGLTIVIYSKKGVDTNTNLTFISMLSAIPAAVLHADET